ncbi:glycoside hydrolase superfamily [Xylariales sp. PMI_506]|nr:glycoside hydrolase superfamily [Xylariales sp. PMI_506]
MSTSTAQNESQRSVDGVGDGQGSVRNVASCMEEGALKRIVGNLFLVGFDGTAVTKELRELVERHFIGAILLTSKNLESAEQAMLLISNIQWCAYRAGYKRPLLIAIDQENGSLNSLVDTSITQFPSAMGMAAVASPSLSRLVAAATASELSCVGVNWILGPVLDVLSASRPSPLGVRAFGDDPITVLTHGLENVRGFKKAGVACCGKHFPSYGDVEFTDGSDLSLPTIITTMADLQNRAFLPFRACAQVGMDAILVGGCSLEISGERTDHACLEKSVVSNILRQECQFDGVIVSECLAMEVLRQDIGISQGTTKAIRAGCDIVTICHSYQAQLEGLSALMLAVQGGTILLDDILASNNRVNVMKDQCTSWERALEIRDPARLTSLNVTHLPLSIDAYRGAISLVRNAADSLVHIMNLAEEKEVLLLTPLIELFPSTATRKTSKHRTSSSTGLSRLAPGEDTFQAFGTILAEYLNVRLIHTSYSSNGLRPLHEQLILRSSAVIILTADAVRNAYQYGVTKHVSMQCKYQSNEHGSQKPLVVVALSSPYDFLADQEVNTYICTYDFTAPSLNNLARLLSGSLHSTQRLPLALGRRETSQNIGKEERPSEAAWLVEPYDEDRDRVALERLLSRIPTAPQPSLLIPSTFKLTGVVPEMNSFVVRNSSTKTLLGVVTTSMGGSETRGQIESILVDPDRRGVGIEASLREHALSYLTGSGSSRPVNVASNQA